MDLLDVHPKGLNSPDNDILLRAGEIGNLPPKFSAKAKGGQCPPPFPPLDLSDTKRGGHFLNLSYVGNLTAKVDGDYIIPPQKIAIYARFSRFGRGQVGIKYNAVNQDNLRRGGRKELTRENLTAHARRMIQGVGDYFEAKVNAGGQSSVMITFTYARNVPDDKTAKRHLHNLIKAMRRAGHFKYYAWVAQLQTGERAKAKGLKSYRAEHGSAIHFHVLTDKVPVAVVRKHWVRIVNEWERSEGMNITERLGGVDIRAVYNASNYISKYISKETQSGSIKGSLWGISTEVRKEIGIKDTEPIETTDQEWQSFVKSFHLFGSNNLINKNRIEAKLRKEGKPVLLKQYIDVRDERYGHSVYGVKDWNDKFLLFSKNVPNLMREFVRFQRNQIRIKAIAENKKSFPDSFAVGSVWDSVLIDSK